MTPDLLLGGWMLLAAVVYVLTGGADYGGGVWDLLATGPRKGAQRRLIEEAIAPVWEANHVWLIALVVILFSGFPKAFAAVSIALHIPLTMLLLGIVARGAAFTFRAYDRKEDRVQRRWGLVFSISSIVTPVLLGVIVGSLSTGAITLVDGRVTSGFLHPWATLLFPWVVGLFTLAGFAYLAAVYLTVESDGEGLAEDFRRRALGAWAAVAVLGAATLVLASTQAPGFYRELRSVGIPVVFFGFTVAVAGLALLFLVQRRYRLARLSAAAQMALVVGGWGAAQHPHLILDDLTLAQAASPPNVQWAIFLVLSVGGIPLAIALYYLMRVFKGGRDVTRRPTTDGGGPPHQTSD